MGLFARGGHSVVDIPGCRVLPASLSRVAAAIRRLVRSAPAGSPLAPFGPRGAGALRAVDLREACDEQVRVLVTFVLQRERAGSLAAWREVAEELVRICPQVAGVAANLHEGRSPQILGARTVPLAGVTTVPDRAGRSVHLATFGSFVQAHRAQTEAVHGWLAEHLLATPSAPGPRSHGTRPRVLDLYGGSGAIALGLAAAGARVTLVESFAPAAAQARAAARAQGLDVDVENADASAAVRRMCDRGERFDAVVVNPPRRGAHPSVRTGLARLAPDLVAYVSCDPDTLARDLDHLARLGYQAAPLRPIDMIPLTEQVETVALLRRGRPCPPRVAYEDEAMLIVDKGPHEPTAARPGHPGSLEARARLLPGAAEAVAVYDLDADASGLVLLARRPGDLEKCRRALSDAAARATYIAALRGAVPAAGAIARGPRDGAGLAATRTRYRLEAVAGGHSLVHAVPDLGGADTVRRHFAAMGHPVLGDGRYGHAPSNRHFEEKAGLDRVFLHCHRLQLAHPDTGAPVTARSSLPADLQAALERIGDPAALSQPLTDR